MNFKVEVNKEQLTVIGKGAMKVGKSIVVEGTKAVALKGAAAVITQSFDGGLGSVKSLELDDVLNGGKKKKKAPKVALFAFKKKKEEDGDIVEAQIGVEPELETTETEIVEVEKTKKARKEK